MMKGKCQWHEEDCDRAIECMECERFPDNEDKPNFTAEPKKVTVYEYGCPMCPACGEPPYDEGRCHFCGQRYIDERKPERPTLRGAHYLDGTDEAVCDKCSAPQSLWRFVAHGDGPKVYRNTYNCQCGQCITATHQRNAPAERRCGMVSRKKARTYWRRLCGTVAMLGFILILGTAGSSDLDLIPFSQILIQSGIGLAMFGGGLWLGGFIE